MRRSALLLLASLIAVSGATASPRSDGLVSKAVQALGGESALDTTARTKQSMESNPPAHAMSGLRLATVQREMRRASPMMFLDMLRNPDRVSDAGDVTSGGTAYPAVNYTVSGQTFTVAFD